MLVKRSEIGRRVSGPRVPTGKAAPHILKQARPVAVSGTVVRIGRIAQTGSAVGTVQLRCTRSKQSRTSFQTRIYLMDARKAAFIGLPKRV